MQSSTYTVGPPQVDGRTYVTETHVDDSGVVYSFEYLADATVDRDAVLAARAARIQTEVAARVIAMQGVIPVNRITSQALLARLTGTERAVIELAATDVPTADQATRLQAAGLRSEMSRLMSSSYIDLDRRDDGSAWAGLHGLEAAGLLAAGRADAIITATVQPIEMAA